MPPSRADSAATTKWLVYEDVPSLPAKVPSVYIDMSGSMALRTAVHTHLADALTYSCSVGGTHWDDLGGAKGLAGPRPVLFFAPAQVAKRRDDWGADGFDRRLADAWQDFVRAVSLGRPRWLEVVRA